MGYPKSHVTIRFYMNHTRYKRWECNDYIYNKIPENLYYYGINSFQLERLHKLWNTDRSNRQGYFILKKKLPLDLVYYIMDFL
jgi:hypothetical protein